MKKRLISSAVSTALALAGTSSAWAVDYHLIAKATSKTMPDGSSVAMWGFAEDAGGACYSIVNGGGNSTASKADRMAAPACTGPVASSPGPRLDVPHNQTTLRVFVTNLLPDPVSLIIPGQELPYSASNNGPTWTSGAVGPRADDNQRVRSFGREAPAEGGRRAYVWRIHNTDPARNNPFRPGSYIYHSGTQPGKQVHMGLYGPATKDSGNGQAYLGRSYHNEVLLFYSEIDPALHAPAQNANPVNYSPEWFLVDVIGQTGNEAPAGEPGQTTLVRFFNASLDYVAPAIQNTYLDLIAEDGHAYPYSRSQYSALLAPMKTKDAVFLPSPDQDYPIPVNWSNHNASASYKGMLATLTATTPGGGGNPPDAVDDSGIAVDEGGLLAGSGLFANDDDGTGNPPTAGTLVSGPSNASAFSFNGDGSFDYTHDGSETTGDSFVYQLSNADGSDQATVNIDVTPVNDAPDAVDDSADVIPDSGVNVIDVLANDSDVDVPAQTLTIVSAGPTLNGGTVSVAVGGLSLTYEPAAAYSGPDSFTYTIDDGSGEANAQATATVNVNVENPVNNAPVAVNEVVDVNLSASTDVPKQFVFDILGNDTDEGVAVDPADYADAPRTRPEEEGIGEVVIQGKKVNGSAKIGGFTWRVTSQGGAVIYNNDGTVTYRPPTDVWVGSDTFKYLLREDPADGSPKLKSNKATVRVNVLP